jgi:hypothetical protein
LNTVIDYTIPAFTINPNSASCGSITYSILGVWNTSSTFIAVISSYSQAGINSFDSTTFETNPQLTIYQTNDAYVGTYMV